MPQSDPPCLFEVILSEKSGECPVAKLLSASHGLPRHLKKISTNLLVDLMLDLVFKTRSALDGIVLHGQSRPGR